MPNTVPQHIGLLNNFLSQELARLREEERKRKFNKTSKEIAQKFKDLGPEATLADAQNAYLSSLEAAADTGNLQDVLPIATGMYNSEIPVLNEAKSLKKNKALLNFYGTTFDENLKNLNPSIARDVGNLFTQGRRLTQIKDKDGRSGYAILDIFSNDGHKLTGKNTFYYGQTAQEIEDMKLKGLLNKEVIKDYIKNGGKSSSDNEEITIPQKISSIKILSTEAETTASNIFVSHPSGAPETMSDGRFIGTAAFSLDNILRDPQKAKDFWTSNSHSEEDLRKIEYKEAGAIDSESGKTLNGFTFVPKTYQRQVEHFINAMEARRNYLTDIESNSNTNPLTRQVLAEYKNKVYDRASQDIETILGDGTATFDEEANLGRYAVIRAIKAITGIEKDNFTAEDWKNISQDQQRKIMQFYVNNSTPTTK